MAEQQFPLAGLTPSSQSLTTLAQKLPNTPQRFWPRIQKISVSVSVEVILIALI